MNLSAVEQVARAVLYEGYLLYPYRPSALKNRQRWMFGRVCPRDWSLAHQGAEPWIMQTECLVAGTPETSLSFAVRFLQIATRTHDPDTPTAADDDAVQTAVEREVAGEVVLREVLEPGTRPRQFPFKFLTDRESQSSQSRRSFKECQPLEGIVEAAAICTESGLYRSTISIRNLTPVESPAACLLDETLLRSLVSTHTILGVAGGEFVSLLDPPETQRAEAEACRNIGTFPVLVGAAGARSMMLSSPIILYDYPQVAAQSPGDLFDSTEIDEVLTLRIQTLTDEEKREMSAADERTRLLLARTGSLSEQQLLDLHAEMRPSGRTFHVGDRVRLRPKGRADAFDLLLDGSAATVVSIEHDFEDRLHVCVVIDADPGKDLGMAGLPGHRFFFRPEEVELLAESANQNGSR